MATIEEKESFLNQIKGISDLGNKKVTISKEDFDRLIGYAEGEIKSEAETIPIGIAFSIADRLYGSDYPLAWSTFVRIKNELLNTPTTQQ